MGAPLEASSAPVAPICVAANGGLGVSSPVLEKRILLAGVMAVLAAVNGCGDGSSGTESSEGGAGAGDTGGTGASGGGGGTAGDAGQGGGGAAGTGSGGAGGQGGAAITCPQFEAGQAVGTITEPGLVELSGLAAGERNPSVLWAHDDEVPVLWALDTMGKVRARYQLEGPGVHANGDNEDIAVIPGQAPGSGHVFLGEIGDNNEVKKTISIYRVLEPAVPDSYVEETLVAETMQVVYPDAPHNAEALLVDPKTAEIFILQKTVSSSATIWHVGQFVPEMTVTAAAMGTVDQGPLITAGDISRDGTLIVLRNYTTTAWVWPRQEGETVPEALSHVPCEITIETEPQGEAICFSQDGKALFSSSEKATQPDPRPLHRYPRK